MVIKVGPAGDSRPGFAWEESECGDLVQIFISHGTGMICSLQFQYVVNGTLTLSRLHGVSTGLKFDTVQLNYPSEFITGVAGHFSYEGINSLTFRTNKGTYGPFGNRVNHDDEFRFHTGQEYNQFVGFHGGTFDSRTITRGIHSIGVYIKPLTAIPSLQRPNIKVEPTHQ